MFLSAQALAIEYGIDDRIAKFFVDREPPKDNMYWKDKLLYLRSRPGYIFLPLITDLYYRSGLPLEKLLSEDFIDVLEKIGHYAAQEEYKLISYEEVNRLCREFASENCSNKEILEEVGNYFDGKKNQIDQLTKPFKALHRGDVFMYALCFLDIDKTKFLELVKTWFALISILLLMDDSEDYITDMRSGDENAFVESGSTKEGFAEIKNMIGESLGHIRSVNQAMAYALQQKLSLITEKPGLEEF